MKSNSQIKQQILVILLAISISTCSNSPGKESVQNGSKITCTQNGCEGTYVGLEFKNGSDIAHQFSNTMSAKVGDKLKELYDKKDYYKVDLSNITMSTKGMGSGKVVFHLKIPFFNVDEPCQAYTSFDHVGGWNHKPALASRKLELSKALIAGHTLDVSELKKTPEGLQEYWIQWKNRIKQAHCR